MVRQPNTVWWPDPSADDRAAAGAKATTHCLSDRVLRDATEEATTLPEDVHYDIRSLCTLFSKPDVVVQSMFSAKRPGLGGGGASGWYDYENANDQENYCPDMGGDDGGGMDDDDDDGGGFDDDGGGFDSNQTMNGSCMIDAPLQVHDSSTIQQCALTVRGVVSAAAAAANR